MKPLKYKVVIKKIRKAGFVLRRKTSGTYEIWWNEKNKRTCVIPHHKEIKVGTLQSIVKQAGISRKKFDEL